MRQAKSLSTIPPLFIVVAMGVYFYFASILLAGLWGWSVMRGLTFSGASGVVAANALLALPYVLAAVVTGWSGGRVFAGRFVGLIVILTGLTSGAIFLAIHWVFLRHGGLDAGSLRFFGVLVAAVTVAGARPDLVRDGLKSGVRSLRKLRTVGT